MLPKPAVGSYLNLFLKYIVCQNLGKSPFIVSGMWFLGKYGLWVQSMIVRRSGSIVVNICTQTALFCLCSDQQERSLMGDIVSFCLWFKGLESLQGNAWISPTNVYCFRVECYWQILKHALDSYKNCLQANCFKTIRHCSISITKTASLANL